MADTIPRYIAARINQRPPRSVRVILRSTPVVSFGDVRKARVATLGLNPSKFEFIGRDGALLEGDKRRLETLETLRNAKIRLGSNAAAVRIFNGCNEYFHRRPYSFFSVLERVLLHLGVSYYDGSACHLDLAQWATPLWSDLSEQEKEKLLSADSSFLRQQLAHEQIRLLLLCGKTVMEEYRKRFPGVLSAEPFARNGRIRLYKGHTVEGVVVVGWNLNLQRGGDLNVIGKVVRSVWRLRSRKSRSS